MLAEQTPNRRSRCWTVQITQERLGDICVQQERLAHGDDVDRETLPVPNCYYRPQR